VTKAKNSKLFPEDFTWGVSTSAYQIEGAAFKDGKGRSVWDEFCKKPGAIWHGHNGDIACDHYHKYREDIALLKNLGVSAYRLSLCWPRLLPDGTGRVNEKGMDFYNSVIDELLEAGIDPFITLFHWDYPQELYLRGGWLNPDSSHWFAEYAEKVAQRFSDRVTNWFTLNEPQCFISLGHYQGMHAPGLKLSLKESLLAGHNSLLAHGRSVQAIRSSAKKPVKIACSFATQVKIPASSSVQDIDAGRKMMHGVINRDLMNNSWWMDPVLLGKYPEDGIKLFGQDVPEIKPGDMEIINQPVDYCGHNVYTARRFKAGKDGDPVEVPPAAGYNVTSQEDWEVVPEGMYWTLKFMSEKYNVPIMITENGHQNLDSVSLDGEVHDPQRIDYLHRHILQLKKAMDEGVDVTGYFAWTLLDNFEWSFGYRVRVGLVYTDYKTLERIPKDSFRWYKDLIASNGMDL